MFNKRATVLLGAIVCLYVTAGTILGVAIAGKTVTSNEVGTVVVLPFLAGILLGIVPKWWGLITVMLFTIFTGGSLFIESLMPEISEIPNRTAEAAGLFLLALVMLILGIRLVRQRRLSEMRKQGYMLIKEWGRAEKQKLQ